MNFRFLTIQYASACPRCGATCVDQQFGLEESVEAYVAAMVQVFREVWRVLRDDGTLWLNLGDIVYLHILASAVARTPRAPNNRATLEALAIGSRHTSAPRQESPWYNLARCLRLSARRLDTAL